MSKQWKEFENFAFEIQKKLSPNAIVKQNDKIRGKSGRLREIDISIRQRVGQFELLMVIDCKRYKKPVDIKTVESFVGQMLDIGAHQGALVSSTGYTKSAITRAKLAGINLYHLGNTLSNDIKSNMGIPSLCIVRNLKEVGSQIIFASDKLFKILTPVLIYNKDKIALGTEQEVVAKWWFDMEEAFEPGVHSQIIMMNELFLLSENELIPIELKANFCVEELLFYRVQSFDFVGYKDVIKDAFEMQQITTESFSIDSLIRDWELVERPRLAVKPILTYGIRTIHSFVRWE